MCRERGREPAAHMPGVQRPQYCPFLPCLDGLRRMEWFSFRLGMFGAGQAGEEEHLPGSEGDTGMLERDFVSGTGVAGQGVMGTN